MKNKLCHNRYDLKMMFFSQISSTATVKLPVNGTLAHMQSRYHRSMHDR